MWKSRTHSFFVFVFLVCSFSYSLHFFELFVSVNFLSPAMNFKNRGVAFVDGGDDGRRRFALGRGRGGGKPPTPAPLHPVDIVLDGTRDDAYGESLAVQTVLTSLGDNLNELDNAAAVVRGRSLFIFLGGNLEPSGACRINVYLEGVNGTNVARVPPVLTFDNGFLQRYHLSFAIENASTLTCVFNETNTDAAAATPLRSGSAVATFNQTAKSSSVGVFGSIGVRFALNNANDAGVGENATSTYLVAADSNAADEVNTGLEIEIPLDLLQFAPLNASLARVCALIYNSSNSHFSTQVLAGLPVGAAFSHAATPNFAVLAGDQFFSIPLIPSVTTTKTTTAATTSSTTSATSTTSAMSTTTVRTTTPTTSMTETVQRQTLTVSTMMAATEITMTPSKPASTTSLEMGLSALTGNRLPSASMTDETAFQGAIIGGSIGAVLVLLAVVLVAIKCALLRGKREQCADTEMKPPASSVVESDQPNNAEKAASFGIVDSNETVKDERTSGHYERMSKAMSIGSCASNYSDLTTYEVGGAKTE